MEKVEAVTDFIFLDKLTVDGDCSHDTKWHLLLGRRAMRNLGGMLKSRDAMLLAKLPQSRLQLFHRSCTDVRAGPWETWALRSGRFQTAVLEETLESPWTARRSNQSILKEINPECSLERLMLKLKFQYFGHLIQRADSLKKTLMLGKMGREKKGATEDEMVGWHH